MKKMRLLAFAAMAATAAVTFAGCTTGGSVADTNTTEAPAESTESVSNQNQSESTAADTSSKYDISGTDFGKPDIVIKEGDFDEMKQLASDISEGKMEGKVVEAEGYYSDNIGHSIMERNAQDTGGVGFGFEVVDFADEDYPVHESKIKITGVVKDTGEEAAGFKVYTIVVPKDNFKVL